MKKLPTSVSINNIAVRKDDQGRLSLTDLHRAAKAGVNKSPAAWLRTDAAQAFVRSACRFLNVVENHIIETSRGRNGGTFGHQQVALEYAQYLSPDLAVAVNQLFFDRVAEEKNPDLILDRAERTYLRRGLTPDQIRARFMGKATRKDLVQTLSQHGVHGAGFRLCTNATYTPLWGGSASFIKGRKGLPEKANLRDHMSEKELVALRLSELMAKEDIEATNLRGNKDCAAACKRASQSVAAVLVAHRDKRPLPIAA